MVQIGLHFVKLNNFDSGIGLRKVKFEELCKPTRML